MATIPELLDGHVTLEVECLDRLYLNGYIGKLATLVDDCVSASGAVVGIVPPRHSPDGQGDRGRINNPF